MARQVLRHFVKLEKFAHLGMMQIEAGLAKVAVGSLVGVLPFPVTHEAAEFFERRDFEAERFADFTRGGAPAIGDDVRGHGGAELSETLVDVLNGLLALI